MCNFQRNKLGTKKTTKIDTRESVVHTEEEEDSEREIERIRVWAYFVRSDFFTRNFNLPFIPNGSPDHSSGLSKFHRDTERRVMDGYITFLGVD